jgi:hypothetical protein
MHARCTHTARTLHGFELGIRARPGWSWGSTSLIDSAGQTLFNVDAHRHDGRRYIVRTDELLTAFLELEATLSVARATNRSCEWEEVISIGLRDF